MTGSAADVINSTLCWQVSLRVQRQVIRTCKGPVAVWADERSDAGVLAVMSGQFVGARETPVTAGYLAAKRPVTIVNSLMSFEM
jgi:hypothetical protein